jgi:hypothetical protein
VADTGLASTSPARLPCADGVPGCSSATQSGLVLRKAYETDVELSRAGNLDDAVQRQRNAPYAPSVAELVRLLRSSLAS